MANPTFIKLTKHQKIDSRNIFTIPSSIPFFRNKDPVRPSHIGLKNRKLAFFFCNDSLVEYHSTSNWHFFLIPAEALKGRLPEVVIDTENMVNNFYGQPKWFFS